MSDLGRALAHPLRRHLLLEYSASDDNPGRLARALGEPLNRVAYHTGVLHRHGFIRLVRTERRRGALTRFYRATVATVIESDDWLSLPAPLRRTLTFGTLEQSLDESRSAARNGGFDAAESHLSRWCLELDDDAAQDVEECLREALDEIARIAAECRARTSERVPCEVVLMSFASRQA